MNGSQIQSSSHQVQFVAWDSPEGDQVREIRNQVFVKELGIPLGLDLDNIDPIAQHVLAQGGPTAPYGTARMYTDAACAATAVIGRVAVLPEFRKSGCGKAMMRTLMTEARAQGFTKVRLSSIVKCTPFYERLGFRAVGEEYLDTGIPHRMMEAVI